ncbi:MAG: PEP-CTERM sorting domain-containing protein [Fimbriimonadia bacterium]
MAEVWGHGHPNRPEPIPEPSCMAAMCVGLVAFSLRWRFRR